MANYCGITRTNYFHVVDPDRLRKIISEIRTDNGSLDIWTREYEGSKLYAFGGYCSISGLPVSFDHMAKGITDDGDAGQYDDDDPDFDAFVDALQKIVAPNDAIIITEIGHEKLRYLSAYSIIITTKYTEYVELRELSIDTAQRLLSNPDWDTGTEY